MKLSIFTYNYIIEIEFQIDTLSFFFKQTVLLVFGLNHRASVVVKIKLTKRY